MTKNRTHRFVFWIALALLLILRIPLASWVTYWFPASSGWITPLYEIGTYLTIFFLIWWERERLSYYHFDPLAILIFIFFKPLSTVLLNVMGMPGHVMAFPKIPSLVILLVAATLIVLVFKKAISIKADYRRSLLWFLLGSLAGIGLFVFYGMLMIWWLNYPVQPDPGSMALLAPVYQLGYAAVAEEPVFRGFLWGGLRSTGLKEIWVLLIQAALFASAHIHLLDSAQPGLFLGMTFLNGVIFGLFVWRSRLLSSSMALHGFANGSVIVQYWVYSFFFR